MPKAKATRTVPIDKQPMWSVYDSNATEGPRRHAVLDQNKKQVHYDLKLDIATPMPREHAQVFLKDEAFVVHDERGRRVSHVKSTDDFKKLSDLPPNMVVATLHELSPEALAQRCRQFGARNYTRSTPKHPMITFLVEQHAMQRGAKIEKEQDDFADNPPPEEPAALGDGDAKAADAIFGKRGATLQGVERREHT